MNYALVLNQFNYTTSRYCSYDMC